MDTNTLIRAILRVVVCLGIVGTYLYCVVTERVCASVLEPYAVGVLASELGVEGLLKLAQQYLTSKPVKG